MVFAIGGEGDLRIGPDVTDQTNGTRVLIRQSGEAHFGGDAGNRNGNITLNADGSATFATDVNIVFGRFESNVQLASQTLFQGNLNGVKVWGVRGDGSASFSNTVFELEQDNPANYTTTMVDGEEQQVYTGPTLDVKEKLLDFVARIEALEAEVQQLKGGN